MELRRIGLAVLACLLVLAGCSRLVQQDVVRALNAAGCTGAPTVEYQHLSDRVVLSVSVQECTCPHPGGVAELAPRVEAVRAMRRAIWTTSTLWFDSVLVTVYRTAEDPARTRPQSVQISRDQLAAELGPRNPALDSSAVFDDGGRTAWMIIPLLAAFIGLLMLVGFARAARRGRIVPVWIIGR